MIKSKIGFNSPLISSTETERWRRPKHTTNMWICAQERHTSPLTSVHYHIDDMCTFPTCFEPSIPWRCGWDSFKVCGSPLWPIMHIPMFWYHFWHVPFDPLEAPYGHSARPTTLLSPAESQITYFQAKRSRTGRVTDEKHQFVWDTRHYHLNPTQGCRRCYPDVRFDVL